MLAVNQRKNEWEFEERFSESFSFFAWVLLLFTSILVLHELCMKRVRNEFIMTSILIGFLPWTCSVADLICLWLSAWFNSACFLFTALWANSRTVRGDHRQWVGDGQAEWAERHNGQRSYEGIICFMMYTHIYKRGFEWFYNEIASLEVSEL